MQVGVKRRKKGENRTKNHEMVTGFRIKLKGVVP